MLADVAGTLRWSVLILAAEAVALTLLVAVLLYQDVTASPATAAWGVTAYTAILAGLFGVLAWALSRCRVWARGPAIVLQLLLLPIGYYMVAGGLAWLGIPVMAIGLGGAGTLLAPSTRAALGMR